MPEYTDKMKQDKKAGVFLPLTSPFLSPYKQERLEEDEEETQEEEAGLEEKGWNTLGLCKSIPWGST